MVCRSTCCGKSSRCKTPSSLLTSIRRRDHITPVLCQLHWLPVQRRVEFKIVCLVHPLLTSAAPRLPVCWYSTHLQAWSSSSPFIFSQDTGCSTDVRQLQWQVLLLWDCACGTLYRPLCDRLQAMDSLGDIWKFIYLEPRNHGALWRFVISDEFKAVWLVETRNLKW